VNTSALTAAAGSFYVYGQNNRTLHNTPTPGDAVVFNYAGNGYADHVALVTQVNSDGTIETMSGDWNGQSGSEAQFSSTSHVVLNAPAYPHSVGSSPAVMGMTISGFISPVGLTTAPPPPPPPTPPRGYLDQASCTGIGGWTQDTEEPTKAIFADVYFNGAAGAAGATGIRLTAGDARSDLCTAIGSCDHGYSMMPPRSTLDGKPHSVYVYGINPTAGGANTLLAQAPKSYTCSAPAIAAGDVKRHVTSPTIFGDWQFDSFTDVAPYTTAEIAAVTTGDTFAVAPSLVQVPGNAAVYVLDEGFYRHVTDPTSFAAWRFSSAGVKSITAAALAALKAGPDWPAAPVLAKDPAAPSVYVLDVALPAPVAPDAGPGSGSASGSDGGIKADAGSVAVPRSGSDAGVVTEDGGAPVAESGAANGTATDPSADPTSADGGNGGGCSVARGTNPSAGELVAYALALGAALVMTRRRGSRLVSR
jgi:hypothetical protein